jgi:hypothetical protein
LHDVTSATVCVFSQLFFSPTVLAKQKKLGQNLFSYSLHIATGFRGSGGSVLSYLIF